ncbi:hypothetical protein PG993_013378 [Apiospora rasikravindrae]|uniref:DUF7587 domain-containing protein n=1 Tax=Apiospora rasikravindrae TaxID=990691 RepID=A0ABR1RZ17_9PEZI
MESDIGILVGPVSNLGIGEDAPKHPSEGPSRTRQESRIRRIPPPSTRVREAIQLFDQSSRDAALRVESIRTRFVGADAPRRSVDIDDGDIRLLREGAQGLADFMSNIQTTIDELNDVTERAIYAQLISRGRETKDSTSEAIEKLLSWFGGEIKAIILETLNNVGHPNSVLWKVAEECYKEAASPSGSLNADAYMTRLGRTSPLTVDHLGDKVLRQVYSRCWGDFWVRAIKRSPGGPTLFYPSAPMEANDTDVPAYLFRTFDAASSGRNDEKVVASTMSNGQPQSHSRIDILSLGREQATTLLHKHLTKSNFGADPDDNLMSWTSSPLVAIQYAVWRRQYNNSDDIKICVIDTTKFPPGLFARDTWLLDTYRDTAHQLGEEFVTFWRLRDGECYYNGEYLSQGTLTHANRSCLVSLRQLEEAGLCELYPELGDPEGAKLRAKRLRILRLDWSWKQPTTENDIRHAEQLGSCLSPSQPLHMALMLLSFRNRNLRHFRPGRLCGHPS